MSGAAPERAGREDDQALPVEGQGGDIIGELIERLYERRATGLKRYGRPLQAFNGRDAARDLEDELLDGAAYARQVAREMAALELAVVTLANHVEVTPEKGGVLAAAMALADAVERKHLRLAGG